MNSPAGSGRGRLLRWLLMPIDDLADCLEVQLLSDSRRVRSLLLVLLGATITWWIYVPLHELLHVLGCELAGGSISEVEIAPIYGGHLLAQVLPFVVPASEGAGRVTGFDSGGSDLVYLITDLTPYLLTIFVGVPFVVICGREHRPVLAGGALIVALAPLMNIFGDTYEMGSIIVTRMSSWITGDARYEVLRSDDLFGLLEEISGPAGLLQDSVVGSPAEGYVVIAISFLTGLVIAYLIYIAGHLWPGLPECEPRQPV